MVSNSLNLDLQELLDTLKRLRREQGKTKEYLELRRELPKDWPL
jgi:hypothetical protein